MIQAFLTALLAAILALAGNWSMHLVQARAKLGEERRTWVRSLHSETVDVVADLDLFLRDIRGAAVAGVETEEKAEATNAVVEEKWEGDLLRRVRRLCFGHPDQDVRRAAEQVEDAAWPYIVSASHAREESEPFQYTSTGRARAVDGVNQAMVEFKRAVYAAPTHKPAKKAVGYSGEDRPSYLARAIAADRRKEAQG